MMERPIFYEIDIEPSALTLLAQNGYDVELRAETRPKPRRDGEMFQEIETTGYGTLTIKKRQTAATKSPGA